LLFSATLEGEVGALARKYTREARRHENAPSNGDRPDIRHRFRAVAHEHKVDALASELRAVEDGLTLVFVRTRRGADRLVKRLDRKGVRASAIHGGKSQGNRTRTLGEFERGKINALIATDVAARGIDVRGITHVINFDPPEDRDGYTHRIGRTARAGRSGHGVTFVMPDQEREVGAIAKHLDLHGEYREAGLDAGSRHRPHEPARSHNRGSGNRGGASGRNRNRRSRQRSR
jgi:superfamily II DNA/RNA helicase